MDLNNNNNNNNISDNNNNNNNEQREPKISNIGNSQCGKQTITDEIDEAKRHARNDMDNIMFCYGNDGYQSYNCQELALEFSKLNFNCHLYSNNDYSTLSSRFENFINEDINYGNTKLNLIIYINGKSAIINGKLHYQNILHYDENTQDYEYESIPELVKKLQDKKNLIVLDNQKKGIGVIFKILFILDLDINYGTEKSGEIILSYDELEATKLVYEDNGINGYNKHHFYKEEFKDCGFIYQPINGKHHIDKKETLTNLTKSLLDRIRSENIHGSNLTTILEKMRIELFRESNLLNHSSISLEKKLNIPSISHCFGDDLYPKFKIFYGDPSIMSYQLAPFNNQNSTTSTPNINNNNNNSNKSLESQSKSSINNNIDKNNTDNNNNNSRSISPIPISQNIQENQ